MFDFVLRLTYKTNPGGVKPVNPVSTGWHVNREWLFWVRKLGDIV
jgi:hypothetical protein